MNKNESTKKKITGKELSSQDEVNIKLDTLVELLVSKGILSRMEFERMSTMRLHENMNKFIGPCVNVNFLINQS